MAEIRTAKDLIVYQKAYALAMERETGAAGIANCKFGEGAYSCELRDCANGSNGKV
jgi:hypothetical protein